MSLNKSAFKTKLFVILYANDGVRSDIFAEYLHYGNRDLKNSANNEAFQLFLSDFNIGNFEKEKDKINSKASLFD